MDDGPARGDASRPPRRSSAAEVGSANVGPQDHGDDLFEVHATGDAPVGPDRQSPAAGRRERSNSATELYQRYMPMGLLKFPIPRKPKEKRGGLVRGDHNTGHAGCARLGGGVGDPDSFYLKELI